MLECAFVYAETIFKYSKTTTTYPLGRYCCSAPYSKEPNGLISLIILPVGYHLNTQSIVKSSIELLRGLFSKTNLRMSFDQTIS